MDDTYATSRLLGTPAFRQVRLKVLRWFTVSTALLVLLVASVELVLYPLVVALQAGESTGGSRNLAMLLSLAAFGTSRLVTWYLWAAIGLALLAWLFRVSAGWGWQRGLRVVLLLCVPLALVHQGATLGVFALLPAIRHGIYPVGFDPLGRVALVRQLVGNYFTCVALSGFCLSAVYFARYHEREQQAASLRQQLAEARHQALKMQLHPHFLFNTLNAIVTLVRQRENDTAARMLTGLGALLRQALDEADVPFVSLRQELDFAARYLDLEQLRLREGLEVRWDVDPAAAPVAVPTFLVQPLVENAVRHGVARRERGGTIRIAAHTTGRHLLLTVADDGPGFDGETGDASGLGLRNTRARLHQLYGEDAGLVCDDAPEGGARVTVTLPFGRPSPLAAAAT